MKDDLISRQAAVDLVEEVESKRLKGEIDLTYAPMIKGIKALPSAQPERKTGKWIKVNGKTAINCSTCYHCSWSLSFEDTVKRFNFCPICGADMRGEG